MKSFDIPELFKSNLIAKIKEKRRVKDKLKKDFTPTKLSFPNVEILIARHFGFCYGVENAVEIAYKTLSDHADKRIFLLSEMIHNPDVNADLISRGVQFLMDTKGNRIIPFENLRSDDVVIVPAFGTTIEIQDELKRHGINPYGYDSTCPFVEKVWNRASQIGERGYTIIIHGKPDHEETRATFSHSKENTATLIIKDIKEAELLAEYMKGNKDYDYFYQDFSGRFSEGFNPKQDLKRLGVVNQTTMLANETQEIAEYLKQIILSLNNEIELAKYFANTRDTLCYATNDNQDATYSLLKEEADFAIVIGGYNSSNTGHIVELLESKIQTFFIENPNCIISSHEISHYDLHEKRIKNTSFDFHQFAKPKIILTCGASCPDSVVEATLVKLLGFYGANDLIQEAIEKI